MATFKTRQSGDVTIIEITGKIVIGDGDYITQLITIFELSEEEEEAMESFQ